MDNQRQYAVTSLENWDKYVDTGDSSLLNDIQPEDIDCPSHYVLSWEGSSIVVKNCYIKR